MYYIMYTSIHVLGERNCGTNYLLQLLKGNVGIPVYDTLLVHKHFIFEVLQITQYSRHCVFK